MRIDFENPIIPLQSDGSADGCNKPICSAKGDIEHIVTTGLSNNRI
jgi:hypothetical protein